MKQFLSHDPLNAITQHTDYDHGTDTLLVHSEGEYDSVLELNKKMANDTDYTKDGIRSEFWHYASIPPIVQMKWLVEKGVDVWKKEDAKKVSQLLEDPEYRYLKTTNKIHLMK